METIKMQLQENKPFPNNKLPVVIYKKALDEIFKQNDYSGEDVLGFLEKHHYSNGWINGILSKHHFHSIAHEVVACISGSARVQLGGPESKIITFTQGDVVFLPAGTAHKKMDSTEDFIIVGAYPNGDSYDMRYGEISEYDKVKENIIQVPKPELDPVTGQSFLKD